MGNRFGRNQKRRMRAEAEQLKQSHAAEMRAARDALFREGLEAGALKEEISYAKSIAGRMSVMFEPDTLAIQGRPRAQLQVPKRCTSDSIHAMRAAIAESVPLEVMLADVDEDALGRALHVRVRFGDGTRGYALSRDALRYSPEDALVRNIALELARLIAPALKNI